MLTQYIAAAMAHASIRYLEEDGCFFGEIPGLDGVWADGATAEACRATLQEVLEAWLVVSLAKHLPIPPIDGMTLDVQRVA
jgi:predicted RNase H-like HicB family nuclease